MSSNPQIPHRRSMRLRDWDYSWAWWYYVTICAKDRASIFGKASNDGVELFHAGRIVYSQWQDIPRRFPNVELDDFVVMPNHLHGIIILNEPRGGEVPSPKTSEEGSHNTAGNNEGDETSRNNEGDGTSRNNEGDETSPLRMDTLGRIIAYFKYQSTKAINELDRTPGKKIWQRNYYDHIIRNDADLYHIRQYFSNNPLQWSLDEENPEHHHP